MRRPSQAMTHRRLRGSNGSSPSASPAARASTGSAGESRRRSGAALSAVVAAVLLLVGCATVPTAGPVREHESGGQRIETSVKVAPVPPAPGSSPLLIVEGFLHAMGTDQAGFAIARQYLTPVADAGWRPESGTLIYADGYQPREADTSTEEQPTITLEAVLTGSLSRLGEYREASGGHRQEFRLERVDGEWRISQAPDGLLISRYHFQTNYTVLDLHFMDPTGSVLVPDPRYVAQNVLTPQLAVAAQLAGPGEWLAPAVRQAPWARSVIEEVEILPQGVVVLHLGSAAADLSDEQRRILMAEFTTTLTARPQVAAVQFSVGSTLLTLPDTNTVTLTSADFGGFSAAGQRGGQLLTVRDGAVYPIAARQPWAEGEPIAGGLTTPAAIAARADLAEIAAVNPEGTRLAVSVGSDAEVVLREGERLLRPDYSRLNELWTIGAGAGASGFVVFGADDHEPIAVTVPPEFPVDAVRAFRISPDGTRLALVLDGPQVDGVAVEQVGIARIVRDADGILLDAFRPVTVSPPAEAGRRVLDVGWQTPTELLVLVSHRVTSSVIRVDQDAAHAEDVGPADVAGLSELAVVPGGTQVLRGDGAVYRFEGPFDWEITGLEAEAVAYS